jgi:hypothetical protein
VIRFLSASLRPAVLASAFALLATPSLAAGPFQTLAGTWSGTGIVKLEGGKTERMSCKGYYTNSDGGSGLGLSIRCANASAKIELRASLTSTNGSSIAGTWEERNYNASGNVTGKMSGGKIHLQVGGGLTGSMSVSVGNSKHSVSVVTEGASAFKGVNISFSRSG